MLAFRSAAMGNAQPTFTRIFYTAIWMLAPGNHTCSSMANAKASSLGFLLATLRVLTLGFGAAVSNTAPTFVRKLFATRWVLASTSTHLFRLQHQKFLGSTKNW